MTTKLDPNVWRELTGGGHVKREYWFNGVERGRQCHFPITLGEQSASLPNYYHAQACYAHNVLYCPDWVRLEALTPIS